MKDYLKGTGEVYIGETVPGEILININLYDRLKQLGLINAGDVRDSNVGDSDYAAHIIQPWSIWQDWELNPWDADIIKRTLRTKKDNDRKLDYEKIIHICKERIRQIEKD